MKQRWINMAQEGRLYLKVFCLLFSTFLCSAPTEALAVKVAIVKQHGTPIHDRIVDTVRQSLDPQLAVGLVLRDSEALDTAEIEREADLIITLGHKAAERLSSSERPVVHALLPQAVAVSLLAAEPGRGAGRRRDAYAIYLDQPAGRQLNLLKLLLPKATDVGLLTGPFSEYRLETLARLSRERNLNLIHSAIDDGKQLNQGLADLLPRIDVLLALPDPMVHNRRTLPHLLLTTYRYSVPVIGFSEAYVKAGAIAAVYSSPEQIARQIAEFIEGWSVRAKRPRPGGYFPKYFSVALNANVARSMGMTLPDRNVLEKSLHEMDNGE